MKRLVKLTLKNGEEFFCILIRRYSNVYVFEKDGFVFTLDKNEIKYIDMIGEIKN